MLFKPEEFGNTGFAFQCGRENIFKTELFEKDDVTIIM